METPTDKIAKVWPVLKATLKKNRFEIIDNHYNATKRADKLTDDWDIDMSSALNGLAIAPKSKENAYLIVGFTAEYELFLEWKAGSKTDHVQITSVDEFLKLWKAWITKVVNLAEVNFDPNKMRPIITGDTDDVELNHAQTFWLKLGGKEKVELKKANLLLQEYVRKGLVTYKRETDASGLDTNAKTSKAELVTTTWLYLTFKDRSALTLTNSTFKDGTFTAYTVRHHGVTLFTRGAGKELLPKWIKKSNLIMKEAAENIPTEVPSTEEPINLNMAQTFWWNLTHDDDGYSKPTYATFMELVRAYIDRGAVSFATPNSHNKYVLIFTDDSELYLTRTADGEIFYTDSIKRTDHYDPDMIMRIANIVDNAEAPSMIFAGIDFNPFKAMSEAVNPREYEKVIKSLDHFKEKLYSGRYPQAEKDFEKIISNLQAQLKILKQQRGIKESVLYEGLSPEQKASLKKVLGFAAEKGKAGLKIAGKAAMTFGKAFAKELTLQALNQLANKINPDDIDYDIHAEIEKLDNPDDKMAILVMFARDLVLGKARKEKFDTSNFNDLVRKSDGAPLKIAAMKLFPESVEELGFDTLAEALDEAKILTTAQRLKRSMAFKRIKGKIKIGRAKAARRHASSDQLVKRARNTAKKLMFKKLAKGKSKDEMTFSQRAQIEKIMLKRKKGIDRLAKKLLASVRKKDMDKFKTKKDDK